jgi:hypothetical protein
MAVAMPITIPIHLGPMTYTTNATVTQPFDAAAHLEQARKHRDEFHQARASVAARLRAVKTLFGEAVFESLFAAVEPFTDNAGDAFHHFEQAFSVALDAHAEELRSERLALQMRVTTANERADRMEMLLRFAVVDVTDRYKRSRKPEPAWLADARVAIESPF